MVVNLRQQQALHCMTFVRKSWLYFVRSCNSHLCFSSSDVWTEGKISNVFESNGVLTDIFEPIKIMTTRGYVIAGSKYWE